MIIREASFRDLSRIEQLYDEAQSGDRDASQLHTDRPVPQASTLIRFWYAVSKTLSSLVPITGSGDIFYVAEHPHEGIAGFIQAQAPPSKPKAWQVVNLCTSATPFGKLAAEQLITGLCQHGQEADVHRFYVRLPLDHPLIAAFLEQGFVQYATEQILYRDIEPQGEPPAGLLRTARRDDSGAIHLLYLRTTPATVAAIEAPNRKAWDSAFGGGIIARMGKDDTIHLVAENPGVFGWAGIRPASAARPAVLHLLCDSHDTGAREAFLDAVLAHLPEGPVSCVLRHYDSELIRSLQARGFAVYGTQVLLTRDLAIKVRVAATARARRKKAVLMPAGMARSVTTPPAGLRVLNSSEDVR